MTELVNDIHYRWLMDLSHCKTMQYMKKWIFSLDKTFNFYKPFSAQLELKMAYMEFKYLYYEKNILLTLHIPETE